jgi:hypothetical protein
LAREPCISNPASNYTLSYKQKQFNQDRKHKVANKPKIIRGIVIKTAIKTALIYSIAVLLILDQIEKPRRCA